jgi:hypothetical protein
MSDQIVIGLVPPHQNATEIADAIKRISSADLPLRSVLMHPPLAAQTSFEATGWEFIVEPKLAQDQAALAQTFGQSFRAVFDLAEKLDAKGCVILSSDPSTVTADWVRLLVTPVIQDGYDLVTPCYGTNPFDGMMNRAIVYPMVRALYGKRVRNPMGPDVGISCRLLLLMGAGVKPRLHPLVSLVAEAIATEMRTCQVHLGARIYPALDWNDLSPLLSQLLDALFLDVGRFARWWQRSRVSQPVLEFGQHLPVPGAAAAPDISQLMEGFQSGSRGLVEVWETILPPSTLVELRQLAQEPAASFRMPDETWARIVYDFAIGHRHRAKSRGPLLRAFTPIFLGWAASYALEIAGAAPDAVEHRIEELCVAFEATKPYFVSRWLWPDRVNP